MTAPVSERPGRKFPTLSQFVRGEKRVILIVFHQSLSHIGKDRHSGAGTRTDHRALRQFFTIIRGDLLLDRRFLQ
jgi:hypothetical protein